MTKKGRVLGGAQPPKGGIERGGSPLFGLKKSRGVEQQKIPFKEGWKGL